MKFMTITQVAKEFDVKPSLLKSFDKEGLVVPSRKSKGRRMYSQEDLKLLPTILRLHLALDINMEGIKIIVELVRNLEVMKSQMAFFEGYLKEKLDIDFSDTILPSHRWDK